MNSSVKALILFSISGEVEPGSLEGFFLLKGSVSSSLLLVCWGRGGTRLQVCVKHLLTVGWAAQWGSN